LGGVKRRQQNQKFPSFQIFRFAAGGVGGAANKNDRKFLGFAPRELVERGRGAQGWRWQALRAYDWISSHHALGAWKGQSLRDWKKVRAKVNISAPKNKNARECVLCFFGGYRGRQLLAFRGIEPAGSMFF